MLARIAESGRQRAAPAFAGCGTQIAQLWALMRGAVDELPALAAEQRVAVPFPYPLARDVSEHRRQVSWHWCSQGPDT
jgi:hypothetical protein